MMNKLTHFVAALIFLPTAFAAAQTPTAAQGPPFAAGAAFTRIDTGAVGTHIGRSRGCSWVDYDNDGDLDLFVTNASGENNVLYRNNGNGSFTKITTGFIVNDGGDSRSCSWGDYDNDGDLDLFVANSETENNFFYKNNGDGSFTKITTEPLVTDRANSRSGSWADYDNDGDLDLFVANNGNNALYENNGGGNFAQILASDIVKEIGDFRGFSWGDYDNDGDLDLFVVNYTGNNLLYQNNVRQGAGFTKITTGPVVTDRGNSRSGSWGDYDNDGDLDLFVANNGYNFLYENKGGGNFTKITTGAVVSDSASFQSAGWADYDNDGDLDLFVTGESKNFLYENHVPQGAGFTKIITGAIVTDIGDSRGCSWGDYDNDGDLDLFVANGHAQNSFLYRNAGNRNNWINIHLIGTASNTSAIGAKARIKAILPGRNNPIWQMREISGQTGYLGQNSLNAEFGLGQATIIDSIRVEWPSGIVQDMAHVGVNQFLKIIEPQFTRLTTGAIATEVGSSRGSGWGDYDNDGDLDLFVANFGGNNFLYRNNSHGKPAGTAFTKITSGDIVNNGGYSLSSSWGDYDNDGDLDLFVTNFDENNFLYENNGKGSFTKITIGPVVNDVGYSYSGAWADYDNDGDLDLFVANFGENNSLYQNNGDGGFLKIAAGSIATEAGNSMGSSWGDYDNDGDLDLFVANGSGQNNFLYESDGQGGFTKIISGPIVTDSGNSRSGSWADYDDDGDLDLFVANDDNENNFLYENDGHGRFTKITTGSIVTDSGDSRGGSWGDYDNDGDLDLFVANNGNDFLYENNGNGRFTKITTGPIVTAGGNSWGSSWADYDNDGDLDLFVANRGENNFLYRSNGKGNFTKITSDAIVTAVGICRGSSWADYDNDGDLDLFVANGSGQNNFLYRNNGNRNNWIDIRLVGTVSNASAIGAKISVKAIINSAPIWQRREISGQSGAFAQNSLNAKFGLGAATVVDSIRVQWTSGAVNVFANLKANQFLTLRENHPPRLARRIPDITLSKASPDFVLNLNAEPVIFSDADGDTLIYAATSSDPRIAAAFISGSTITVSLASDTASGQATISVSANDGRVASEAITFKINRSPFVKDQLPDTTLLPGGRLVKDLKQVFGDPEGDKLSFQAATSNDGDVLAALSGDKLVLVAADTGKSLITLIANDSAGGIDSIEFHVQVSFSSPPVIVHNYPAIGRRDEAIAISAKIIDDEGRIEQASLSYRVAGEKFTAVLMDISPIDDTTSQATQIIPADAVTSRGVEYFIKARDNHNVSSRYPTSGIISVRVRVDGEGVQNAFSQPAGGFHLISAPLELENKKPETVLSDDLGPYDPKQWRFFDWTTDAAATVEFPKTADMTPGKAFWLIIRKPGKVIDTGSGTTISTSEKFPISLRTGWNLVGNPFNFTAVFEDRPSAGNKLYIFAFKNGQWSDALPPSSTELQAFEGVAVFCDSACTLFVNPDRSTGSALPKRETAAEANVLWSIRILAQCQQARDGNNVAAVVKKGASREWDRLDYPEPPVIGEYVSVYFPHPEWDRLMANYSTDFRPEPLAGEAWEFEIKTNIRDVVKLSFEGVTTVPAAYDVWLLDEAVQIAQNLRETSLYSVAGSGTDHTEKLKLIVGKPDFVEEKLAKARIIPVAYELSQNFPNPFNPSTTIRYGLPKAERVTLKVYNLMGKELATLVDEELQKAGYHLAIWNGRNADGSMAASGLYFYRISAGSFAMTKTMAFVK